MIEAAFAFIAVFVGIVLFNVLSTTIHFVVKLIIVAIFSYVIFEAVNYPGLKARACKGAA